MFPAVVNPPHGRSKIIVLAYPRVAQLESDLFLSANDSIVRGTPARAAISLTISDQRIARRLLERAEPRLVVPPLVEAFAIDGLAHLFRACGSHAALVLVELQASHLEVKTAEFENSPHIPLQVVDHVLMHDAQHPSRKREIPMLHQVQIGPVISRDIFDAVGELLSGGEELLEVAEATGHRLAPRVDDPGVGQHQVDEAEMP